jgi:hypothetical protein
LTDLFSIEQQTIALSHQTAPAASVVPEQRDQQDDRNWHADQPKQNTSTESHVDLQLLGL